MENEWFQLAQYFYELRLNHPILNLYFVSLNPKNRWPRSKFVVSVTNQLPAPKNG